MLKFVFLTLIFSIFILFVCNTTIKLINSLLLKRSYKLSEKFSYIFAAFLVLLISLFLGKNIMYYLM